MFGVETGDVSTMLALHRSIVLTKEQVRFFDTFGYFVLRNQFSANEVGAISDAFDDVFRTLTCVICETGAFGGMGRHYVVGFVERRPVLEDLAEDDRVYGPLSQLLDPGFIWVASDGNLYVGDSEWHTDKRPSPGYKQIKVAFYLDPLEANTGCLRVIPGSHRPEFHDVLRKQLMEKDRRTSQERPLESLGVAGSEVPSAMLESQPGDVVFFRQEIVHASFGGHVGRRMLAMGIFDRPKTEDLITSVTELYRHHRSQSDEPTVAAFFNSDRPRIRKMIAGLRDMGIE